MTQLVEGRARDHLSDFGIGLIRTNTRSRLGKSQPNTAAGGFHGMGPSAVVDDLLANGGDAAGALQGFGANQNASFGGPGVFAARAPDTRGRVHREKEADQREHPKTVYRRAAMAHPPQRSEH